MPAPGFALRDYRQIVEPRRGADRRNDLGEGPAHRAAAMADLRALGFDFENAESRAGPLHGALVLDLEDRCHSGATLRDEGDVVDGFKAGGESVEMGAAGHRERNRAIDRGTR